MESAAERIIGLYQRHADAWDRLRGDVGDGLFEKPWLDRFLTLLQPGASILDIGCGSGQPISRYFVKKGFKVCRVDSSPELIVKYASRFPGEDWMVGDMRTLSLNRTFAGILAWDSFFHLCPEDQRQMFPIFRSHAASKTALMFTSGATYGESIATFEGEPLYHGSLDDAEYRELLAENGFDVLSHVVEDPTCGRHTIWLTQRR